MTVRQIFTKIGNHIENRQIFTLLNCNCAKLASFEDFQTCLGGAVFSWTQCRIDCYQWQQATAVHKCSLLIITRMWADAQRDGRPAK